jgi:alpha-L-fucosidase
MKSLLLLSLLLSVSLAAAAPAAQAAVSASPSPKPDSAPAVAEETKAQRDMRMAWWRDARFGMFIHWGLYSGLAGTWNGRPLESKKGGMEWIQQFVKADTDTYAAAAFPKFKPVPGFAREWMKLAKEAGCRYVVFTTKHHEGFALHDSKDGDFNAGKKLNRDLVKEIVEAARAEGLKVGFYHSLIDWHDANYDYTRAKGLPYPLAGKTPATPRDHSKYLDHLHAQVGELLTNYGPVDVLWWDFSSKDFQGDEAWRAGDLMRMVRSKQPGIIMNNRLYAASTLNAAKDEHATFNTAHGDFSTPEQRIPQNGMPGVDWESCMTLNTTWGYSDHDHAWKSVETLIRNLCDIASKGGNYLLNIGPKGDGTIPAETVTLMKGIGAWMKVNSGAIYGTTATPFGAEAGSFSPTEKDKKGEPVFKTEWSWRATQKPGHLYLILFKWPTDGKFSVPAFAHSITGATLLADPSAKLTVSQDGKGVTVSGLPAKAPDAIASVIDLKY